MCGVESLWATALFLAVGLPSLIWPGEVAWFGEAVDAIGSTRSSYDVEPADWNVTTTRWFGGLLTLLGTVGAVVCLA